MSYQRTTNLSRHHPPKAVFSTAHRHLNYETNKNFLKESVRATVGKYTYVHVGVLLKRATVSADRPPPPQVQQNCTFPPNSFFHYFWINYRPALWKNFAAALKTLHGRNTFLVTYLVLQSPWLPVQVQGSLHASPSERKIQVHEFECRRRITASCQTSRIHSHLVLSFHCFFCLPDLFKLIQDLKPFKIH